MLEESVTSIANACFMMPVGGVKMFLTEVEMCFCHK